MVKKKHPTFVSKIECFYGIDTQYITKVPDNEIGQAAINSLRKLGVGTDFIVRGGERLGIYFVEKGASQRPSKVIYDRKYSAISMADPKEFNWDEILHDVQWFHFSGITPALSNTAATICYDACKAAKEKNITVSCDLNYRKNLWSCEKAGQVMSGLMKYTDLCIANEEDAADVFGIHASNTDISGGRLDQESYKDVAKQLSERFGFSNVAITLRGSITANDNSWAGMLYDGHDYYFSKTYPVHIVDRVGGGDSFGGGLIYSLLSGFEPQKTIDFAVAASCLKHTIEYDFNMVTVKEVLALVGGNTSGRVQR